jgi:DNA-directed RNA polymerase subunit RPC12/RpoP
MKHNLFVVIFSFLSTLSIASESIYKPTGIYTEPELAAKVESPPVIKVESPKGVHSHKCSKCGTTWSHTDASYGNTHDHTCPQCGKIEWNQTSTVMIQKPVVRQSVSNCPNGNCPLSNAPTYRIRKKR